MLIVSCRGPETFKGLGGGAGGASGVDASGSGGVIEPGSGGASGGTGGEGSGGTGGVVGGSGGTGGVAEGSGGTGGVVGGSGGQTGSAGGGGGQEVGVVVDAAPPDVVDAAQETPGNVDLPGDGAGGSDGAAGGDGAAGRDGAAGSDGVDGGDGAGDARSCVGVAPWSLQALPGYGQGTKVLHGAPPHLFQCKADPQGMWCQFNTYEPQSSTGFWRDAWDDLGTCP